MELALEDFKAAIQHREGAWSLAQEEIAGVFCSAGGVFTVDENVDGDIIISAGQTVIIDDVTITGKVVVEGGTVTITNGAIIQSGVEGKDGASVTIEDGTIVNGDVVISGSGSSLIITAGVEVTGKVQTNEISEVSLTGVTVGSDIVSDKDADVTITGNIVSGNVLIKDPTGTCTDSGQDSPPPNPGCPPPPP